MTIQEARILVVDDEPLLLKIFALWLRRMGCTQVRTAVDGMDALAQLRESPADLLITDIRMPQMDGISLVRTLRAEGIFVSSVILISGFGDVDRRELYALGVEAFLSKPTSLSVLSNQVNESLRPRDQMWQTPFDQAPMQKLVEEGVVFADDDNRPGSPTVSVGRGGFSITCVGILTPGRLRFNLNFTQPEYRLTGDGIVRWYAKSEKAAGIELTQLSELGRSWLLKSCPRANSNGYIPR